jgi:preprotein translocase subunit SecE
MAKGQKKSKKKANIAVRFVQYVKDVRSEMKRVVWPGRQEVVNSSMVVITTLAFFILLVLLVDQIASFVIIEQLAKLGR